MDFNSANSADQRIRLSDIRLGILASIGDTHEVLARFRDRVQDSRIPPNPDPALVCCMVLCADVYSANEDSMAGYNNTMIACIWACIQGAIYLMIHDGTIDIKTSDALLSMRSCRNYESMMKSNNTSIRTNSTDPALLAARTRLIESNRTPITWTPNDTTLVRSQGCRIYHSFSRCIFDAILSCPIVMSHPTAVVCNHNKYPCIVLHDDTINSICLACGMNGPCCILVDVGNHYVHFQMEQSTCPERFMHLGGELPLCIASHLDALTSSNSAPSTQYRPINLVLDKPVITARRHIVWSRLDSVEYSYTVSMVMPTLNFSTYTFRVDTIVPMDAHASSSVLHAELYRIRPFNSHELRVSIDPQDLGYVSISGTLAHWYAPRCVYSSTMISCSIGSSVLQIHRIGTIQDTPSVERLEMRIGVINFMTSAVPVLHNCIVNPVRNKVVIWFPRHGSSSGGPTLTLGCNGGFQWTGSPRDIYRSFNVFAGLVEHNTSSSEFMSIVSQLRVVHHQVYPSGISRQRA